MNKSKNRNDIGKRASLIGTIANILLAAGKLTVGILSFSMAIIADALNNFSDGMSSIVTLICFKLAQKPADEEHPYGHARFEYISSFIVSIIVVFVGFELAKSSIEKIITPEAIEFSALSLLILGASIIVKLVLFFYNRRIGKEINSDALKAVSIDCRNDVIMTSIVLIATLVEYFSGLKIDGYVGLLVSLFILYSGTMLIKDTVSPILGNKNDAKLKEKILNKLKDYPIVIGYHDLMIHDYGPGISFCSIHFEIDKNHDPLYVHELIDKFERELLSAGVNITVHYDPVVTDSEELNQLKHAVVSVLIEEDTRLSVHDFRSIPCDGFTKIFFDLPLPDEMQDKQEHLKSLINTKINELGIGNYQAEITFDSMSFN